MVSSPGDALEQLPNVVRARLMRLDDPDPGQYARKPIPALGDRTIAQVLSEDGLPRVMEYIARLEDLIGVKPPPSPSPFHREGPGTVSHRDGWRVFLASQFRASYVGSNGRVAEASFDGGTLYPATLRWTMPDSRPATVAERQEVVPRIVSGLEELVGNEVDLAPGGPGGALSQG